MIDFIVLVFTLSSLANADIANEAFDRLEVSLGRAIQNSEEWPALEAKLAALRVAERSCRRQMRERHLPYDCYLLKKESVGEWSALQSLIPPSKELARACLAAARRTAETEINRDEIDDAECRRTALEKAELNVYKHGS